jgi:hypothetical protein
MPFLNIVKETSFSKRFGDLRFIKHDECENCSFSRPEAVKKNCPCGDDLPGICYLEAVQQLGENPDDSPFQQSAITYCSDHTNILGENYPARLREITGATGWSKCNDVEQIIALIETTGWGQSPALKKAGTIDWIRKAVERYSFGFVKTSISQSIYSVNGMLLMAMMTRPETLGTYEKVYQTAAECFEETFYSYLKVRKFSEDLQEINRVHPVEILKHFHGLVKDKGRSGISMDERISWSELEGIPASATKKFLAELSNDIVGDVLYFSSDNGVDGTLGMKYIYRVTMLGQSRACAYLPTALKLRKREQFRRTIARPRVMISTKEKLREVQSVYDALNHAGLPEGWLYNLDRKEFLAIEEKVRQTASIENLAKDGGKQETARYYLNRAVKNRWQIEMFDLYTGESEGLYVPEGQGGDHQRDLFWLSVNVILRWATGVGKVKYKGPKWKSFRMTTRLFDASIVHISEQGKERNLVKSSAFLSWFYKPGSIVLAKYLSKHPTHTVGLTGANDAWNLDKRISPFSNESSGIYSRSQDKKTLATVRGFELDLTEATDFAQRERSMAQLQGLIRYSGFPPWYGKLMIMVYKQDQDVTEVITADEGFAIESEPYRGKISEGDMMGLEPTKILLHLTHIAAGEHARQLLARRKNMERPKFASSPLQPDKMVFPSNPQLS